MSARKWKPGDVGMLSGLDGDEVMAFRQERQWATQSHLYLADWQVNARPLVVIDPEDREQVERLMKGLPISWNLFQADDPELGDETVAAGMAALREFATPTPPKPDEPQGLGAVVEDNKGVKHVRAGITHDGLMKDCWRQVSGSNIGYWSTYKNLDVVRVLSVGVTP